jgi:hypothetical protein
MPHQTVDGWPGVEAWNERLWVFVESIRNCDSKAVSFQVILTSRYAKDEKGEASRSCAAVTEHMENHMSVQM